jgi:hypothetical protein
MELQRARVSTDEILQYFDMLSIVLDGTSSNFVWNINEMGHAD